MATSRIYLSGWEYNRLLSAEPFGATQSGLPAEVLWNGASQFWLFEKVLCSKESLDGDLAAANDLGWTTGNIFDDLRRRGFLESVDVADRAAGDRLLRTDMEKAWKNLKTTYPGEAALMALLETGADDKLEAIKLGLLAPLLRHLKCVQNVSPNSIRHWMTSDPRTVRQRVVADGLQALVEPLLRVSPIVLPGLALCNRPGFGVDPRHLKEQKEIEERIQRPMIPALLANRLPQEEYHDALRETASIYVPINEQLWRDYEASIDRLERLRDIAQQVLWKDLHGEWLPRLESDPSFLPEFKMLIQRAVRRSKADTFSEWSTDTVINVTSMVIGGGLGYAGSIIGGASDGTVGAAIGAGFGKVITDSVKRFFDVRHRDLRKASETLTLFYQRVRRGV